MWKADSTGDNAVPETGQLHRNHILTKRLWTRTIDMSNTMETLGSTYEKLMARTKEVIILATARGTIYWDMETMMPPKGVELRSQQLGMLSKIIHRMSTDPEIERILSKIENHQDYESLTEMQKRNVYLARKQYDEQTKLPERLVVDIAKQEAIAIDVWKKAKAEKKFSTFKPELEKMLDLKREAANIFMDVKQTTTPYDALIDIYEPKMTASAIARIFTQLREGLVSILDKCSNAPIKPDTSFLKRRVPIDTQRKVSKELAHFIGYDIDSPNAGGRIDETEHPFTTGYYDDVRITTHYYDDDVSNSLFSVLHEGGHAIYDQNLKKDWIYQPIGTATSLGFHESQSRFVENIVGRSREFWTYFLPIVNKLTNNTFQDVSLDSFARAINEVKPSKIRVEADEVTYCLHIIIRFEIEQELIPSHIKVADLPELWNEKYRDYLGVKIENDSEGVMQDIHWAGGDFGYFPTYALGNIFSGQLLKTMEHSMPKWRDGIAVGNFKKVKSWLTKNVHEYGDLYNPAALIKKITGEEIHVEPYMNYLNQKYSWVYGF